jgi:phosphoglycolate phosphatase
MRRLAAEAADRIPLFPGIAPALLALRDRGVRLAIASSNGEETVRRILGPELAAAFQHFECGIPLFGKARRIRRIVRRSGVVATEAIFIGDETRDVEAAGQAGVAAAVVLWGYARPEAFADFPPLVRFAALEEMLSFLTPAEEGAATRLTV